ncbi:hypothetical protein GE061_014515 [Apolygus lucorum]|uniref:Uncharacterized protein n=1 Tax=Apolygus lucorum TaxID=248454 RepID=A0A8S9XMF7_APOLU|nr:hypothetical protein GE061_014515 [Apolygus lucorum]
MNSDRESKYLTPCRSFGLKRINKKSPSTPELTMNSDRGSKYLTPCRSFGLKRINKKSPSTPGSQVAVKSVYSPFTSPMVVTTASTVPCVEKKCPLQQNSLWSTPLINKTSLKMGLSKPSGKLKMSRLLQSKDLLNDDTSSGSSSNKCMDCSGAHRIGMCQGGSSKSNISSHEESPKQVLNGSGVNSTPTSNLVKSTKKDDSIQSSRKTSPGKLSDVCTNSRSVMNVSVCDISANTYRGNDDSTKTSFEKSSSMESIKNAFLGWDSDCGEAVSLNSILERFKMFLENRIVKPNEACSPLSLDVACHTDRLLNAEHSPEGCTKEETARPSACNPQYESAGFHESQAVSNKGQLERNGKSCATKILSDEGELQSSQTSMLFDSSLEDETEDEWDFVTSQRHLETHEMKQKIVKKMSLPKQSSSRISKKRTAQNRTVVQSVNSEESGDCHTDEELQSEAIDSSSGAEKQLEEDIRRWLEGGQRVILEIIDEVRRQKDREMTVMEVLLEQGVDPNLVGYDPQREEFLTFDKFMLHNDIS